jgi:hypothetical protein
MNSLTACPYCGESVHPRAEFCRHCGEDLTRDMLEGERPIAVRRDCESHRAGLIVPMAIAGLVLSFLHILAVIGMPLCFAAWRMSRTDLDKMRAGLMDPEGMTSTLFGNRWSIIGMIVGSIWLVLFVVVFILSGLAV